MEKLKKILKWVGTDGLLHFLVCYALMLTFTPMVGVWWSILIAIVPSLAKEGWDYFVQKDNDRSQVIHDLICDGLGMATAYLTIFLWW